MRRVTNALFIAIALVGVAGSALAADNMTVGANEIRRVMLRGSAASVVVGDPAIADVAMVNAHSVNIVGHAFGVTEVMVLDHAGQVLFDSRIIVRAPDEDHVTVHRGAATTEYACSPRCQAMDTAKGGGGVGGAVGAAVGGLVNGVLPNPTNVGPPAAGAAAPGV